MDAVHIFVCVRASLGIYSRKTYKNTNFLLLFCLFIFYIMLLVMQSLYIIIESFSWLSFAYIQHNMISLAHSAYFVCRLCIEHFVYTKHTSFLDICIPKVNSTVSKSRSTNFYWVYNFIQCLFFFLVLLFCGFIFVCVTGLRYKFIVYGYRMVEGGGVTLVQQYINQENNIKLSINETLKSHRYNEPLQIHTANAFQKKKKITREIIKNLWFSQK